MGLGMVEAAAASGALRPGGTVIEATAGNTGIALGLVTIARGYRLVLVIPDKMSEEKVAHARALGAEIVITGLHSSDRPGRAKRRSGGTMTRRRVR